MVSKTRKQRQKIAAKIAQNHGVMPSAAPPAERKSVHLKKNRPNMKGKMKVRLGLESPDIYSGFEDKKGVQWQCQSCGRVSRVVGFCLQCTTGRKVKEHTGIMMSRDRVSGPPDAARGRRADGAAAPAKDTKKAVLQSAKKQGGKLRFKKKH